MKGLRLLLIMLPLLCMAGMSVGAGAEQPLFGPVKYDVKQRYGKKNLYSGALSVNDGLYLIKLQNGEDPSQRSDYIELAVDGRPVVVDGHYLFNYFACFVRLGKESRFELLLKDERPGGFRRPPATPKNVTLTVLPVPKGMEALSGSIGLLTWEGLKEKADVLLGIKDPASRALAMNAISMHLDPGGRAEAIRMLSDRNDKGAEDFLVRVFKDPYTEADVRAEAVLALAALNDVKHVKLIMLGLIDPDDHISIASARGLSFYPEEATKDELIQVLERLDSLRRRPIIQSIIDSGWKPVGAAAEMAASKDVYVANMAIDMLGKLHDQRATDALLVLLKDEGQSNARSIVRALGESGDPKAVDALIAIASDPKQRGGMEVDLGDAFVALGDRRAADVLGKMIKQAPSPSVENRLENDYRALTGKSY
jgi:HEAT repeat protein